MSVTTIHIRFKTGNLNSDDGNKMRGHRLNIFSERFKFLGLAVGPHKKFKYCCVVNFAVEYEEKEEEEDMVYEDKLPDLVPEGADDDEFYPEEYEEMAEWKGPGGFPHQIGVANKKNPVMSKIEKPKQAPKNNFGFNKKNVEVKANAPSLPPPSKDPVLQFNKKKVTTKVNGKAPPLTIKKNPNANKKQPKCRIVTVKMGSHDMDEDVHEEVVEIKRKLTIEDYCSDKEIKAGNYAHPIDNNKDTEEVEEFRGNDFNFKKKKEQSNNMYMKRGANRNQYLNQNPARHKTLSRDKPNQLQVNVNKKMANTSPNIRRNSKNKPHKPYTIPRKNSPYKVSKSPRRINNYKKYTAPNQMNMKGELIRNQKTEQLQKSGSDLIKDQRSKALLKMDDFTIPHKAINCLTKRIIRTQGNQRIKTVRKIFTMRDGTQEIHENVFVERIDETK